MLPFSPKLFDYSVDCCIKSCRYTCTSMLPLHCSEFIWPIECEWKLATCVSILLLGVGGGRDTTQRGYEKPSRGKGNYGSLMRLRWGDEYLRMWKAQVSHFIDCKFTFSPRLFFFMFIFYISLSHNSPQFIRMVMIFFLIIRYILYLLRFI